MWKNNGTFSPLQYAKGGRVAGGTIDKRKSIMANREKQTIWTTIAGWLFGIVMAGGAAWLNYGQSAVDRHEVGRMIEQHSPYVVEKGTIHHILDANTVAIEKLTTAVEQLKLEQALTNDRLKGLMEKMEKR
ncbi:hypothetical protein ACFLQV_01455 [Calditrichota bacterium]